MNAAHLHLVFNHVPLFGLIAGIVLLLWGITRNSAEVRLIARITFVLAALSAVAVYITGKGAEEIVEDVPGVLERVVDLHADVATIALIGIAVTGIVAAIGILLDRAGQQAKRLAVGALLLVSIVSLAFTGYAANLGGQIRHPEITGVSTER